MPQRAAFALIAPLCAVPCLAQTPTLAIADKTVTEGNTGSLAAGFVVTLSAAATSTVTVAFTTVDGTAKAATDYTATSGILSFAPGVRSLTISVPVIGDTVVEPDETFRVTLSTPTGATLADAQAVGTIVNTDRPTISIADRTLNEPATTADALFAVTLSAVHNMPVTVDYTTVDGPAKAGTDYVATAGTLTFAPGQRTQNVVVPVNGDVLVEADESHFDGQHYVESGAPVSTLDGWLNRHLVSVPRPGPLRAAGFGSELPHALRGQQTVSSFNDIAEFSTELPTDTEAALLSDLTRVYDQTPDNSRAYRDLVYGSGRVMVNHLSVLSVIDVGAYVPANGAVYPNTTLGRQLRQVAQIVKQDLGLEVACLGIGGWDTHADQGNGDAAAQQSRRHQDFGGSIGAFYTDLGPSMADVVVLTMTEFGRTAHENGSRGTDHGHAAAWFVAGGNIAGGVYGAWPGVSSSQLLYGRYLNHSVDFRDVMGEILTRHLGSTDLATILPGHSYAPVGFLPA